MRWYADDTDLRLAAGHSMPNVVLYGGFTVKKSDELNLRRDIEEVKQRYSNSRAPIKWNLQDLKKEYNKKGSNEFYDMMWQHRAEIKKEIFEVLAAHDISIIVSIVKSYTDDKSKLKKSKADLARYVFANGLMRFALQCKEKGADQPEVVLDWPDGSNSLPYDEEFASAFNYGKSKDGQGYTSGALSTLNFTDSIHYTRMKHSTMLQVADLIVGATREFIDHALDSEKAKHGSKLLRLIAPKFRGYPTNVMGRGIVVSNSDLKSKINERFIELYIDEDLAPFL